MLYVRFSSWVLGEHCSNQVDLLRTDGVRILSLFVVQIYAACALVHRENVGWLMCPDRLDKRQTAGQIRIGLDIALNADWHNG